MLTLLRGITVLDVTTIVLGPMATQILADLGASVIKVEAPAGDLARAAQPFREDGVGALYHNNNRNKRSIAIDLKSEAGRQTMARLVEHSDVLVHNMRPRAMDALGFAPQAAMRLNPRLIYCAAVGFGSDGPYAGQPAYDDVIQAASGIAGLAARVGDRPAYIPSIFADKVTALYVVNAVLAALFDRQRTGSGHEVEVPMFESMVAFLMSEHLAGATFSEDGSCGYHRMLEPDRRPFETADGWIAILPYTEDQWRRLLVEIGHAGLVESAWFRNPRERSGRIGELYRLVAAASPGRTTDQWMSTLRELDIPYARVNSLEDLLRDPHLQSIDFFSPRPPGKGTVRSVPQPIRFHDAPEEEDRPAPGLGADTVEILAEIGYSPAEIDALIESNAVATSAI